MDLESIVMELIVNGGNARSKALEAIAAASRKDFNLAARKMSECSGSLQQAHECQTGLIQREAMGDQTIAPNLLLVHAQDHLMDAMTIRDLAQQMIRMYRIIYGQE